MSKNKKIILVAGIAKVEGKQHPGGQLTATRILLKSKISDYFDISVIDISARSQPPEIFPTKVYKGTKRIFKFIKILISQKIYAVYLFSAFGFSFWEKIVMSYLTNMAGGRSILAVVSGHFYDNVRNSKFKSIYKMALNIPDIIICQGPTWVDFYSSIGISKNKCIIVPNWIDPSFYIDCRTEQPKDNNITFVYVGFLVRKKGVYDLLEAIKRIESVLPGASWIFVGGGSEEDELRKKVLLYKLSSKVEITGWKNTEQVKKYYKRANAFVFPTHAEGFPNSLIEAMSSGLPVITTPVGGIPGIIKNGEHGILTTTHNPDELSKAMLRIANDYNFRNNAAEAVIKHVYEHHDIDKIWKDLARIIEGA